MPSGLEAKTSVEISIASLLAFKCVCSIRVFYKDTCLVATGVDLHII